MAQGSHHCNIIIYFQLLLLSEPLALRTNKNLLTDAAAVTTTTMSAEVGSVKPNPYIFDIENRRKRKPRLAHDLGAGAKCNKCGDKCPGFELHFWRWVVAVGSCLYHKYDICHKDHFADRHPCKHNRNIPRCWIYMVMYHKCIIDL